MGKASISIAISGSYNGSAVERAEKSLQRLAVRTAAAEGSMSKSWVETGSKAAEAGGRIYNAGQQVADAGDAMTAGITVPLAAVGAASAKTAMDFESSMSRVSGALNDPQANMEELRQLALDMGADTVFSASEAGAAMEELAKGGLTAADIKGGALKTTMDLAAAGNLELAEAANVTVQAMGAFSLSADQTGEAANALAGAAAASSADVSDLTQGLSQASAQANSAGWSIQDTTATLAAFADAGIKGSDAGTSLKTMLQRLAAPTDKAASMMASLGINVRDSDGSMLDAASVAGILQAQLGGLDSATRDAALQTIFGADASRAALVMINQGTEGIQRYTSATNDQAAAQRLADSQMGETQRSIEEMNGAIETASIQVGSALAPSITSAANAAGDAAESFSEMDEGTQQAVVGFGLVAAAAGPVLSVAGRITKGFGSMVTAAGRAAQDVGVYADALTTTNVASLKAYQGNDKLAKALERNPAAKAAGGVQQYIDAVTGANKAQAEYNSSFRQLEREQRKGSRANQEIIASLQTEVAERKSAADAAKSTVDGYRASAAAAKTSTSAVAAQSVAMKAASVAATGLKLALATIAPIAVIAGITAVADAFMKAKEHEDLLADATVSASSIMSGASGAAEGLGDAIGGIAVDSEETLQSLADLNKSVSDTLGGAVVDSAKLDQYMGVINDLANQTGLTAAEQYQLTEAVKGYNEVTGESYSVVDAANGKIADQNGVLQENTDKLNDSANAWKQRAQSEAMSNVATQYLEQEAEAAYKLQIAQDNLNSTKQRAAELSNIASGATGASADEMARAGMEADKLYREIPGLETEVNDLAAAHETAAQSAEDFSNAAAIQSSVFATLGDDAMEFTSQLGETGIGLETFASLTDEQLTGIASRWDGTSGSILSAMSELKIGIPAAGWTSMLGLETALDEGGASAINTALGVSGMTAQQFADKVGEYGLSGNASIVAFANAIAAGDTYDVAAQKAADGVSGLSSQNGSAYSAGSGLAASANSGMSSIDTWTSGLHLGSNFASGIRAAYNSVVSAASAVASAAASSLQFSVPKSGPWSGSERGGVTSGMHLVQNFAKGMLMGAPSVSSAARAVSGGISLTGSSAYGPSARAYSAPAAQSRDDVSVLLVQLIDEVAALRQELGPTIANYAPSFPTERQAKRKVQEWTR